MRIGTRIGAGFAGVVGLTVLVGVTGWKVTTVNVV